MLTVQNAAAALPAKRTLITRPIQDIRPGMRVIAKNPELLGFEMPDSQIEPDTWRIVRLQMEKSNGARVDIALLRSSDWLAENNVELGGTVELDLTELGVCGPAAVLSIAPCPMIETGGGRIVTGTFAHFSKEIVDVRVSGSKGAIGCTPNHPFWSEDRQAFVSAGDLRVGEAVAQVDGELVFVIGIKNHVSAQPVFNLEVDVEHTYFVSESGILVHNECGTTFPALISHAAKHEIGGRVLSVGKYLKDALANVQNGLRVRFFHDGQQKWAFLSRTKDGLIKLTSTSKNKRTIFTHFETNEKYLSNLGITLPKGF